VGESDGLWSAGFQRERQRQTERETERQRVHEQSVIRKTVFRARAVPDWVCPFPGKEGIRTPVSFRTRNVHRGTSLIRNRTHLGPYSRPMPRALWWSLGGGRFLMSEVPL